MDYFNLLFENQPAENSPGLSDDELAAIAEQAGAGSAAECIADGTYKRFVTSQTNDHEIQGAPTVEIDGERIENSQLDARLGEILG